MFNHELEKASAADTIRYIPIRGYWHTDTIHDTNIAILHKLPRMTKDIDTLLTQVSAAGLTLETPY